MIPEYDTEVVAAWVLTHLWGGSPILHLRLEMISAELPFPISDEAFEASKRLLQILGLITADLQITRRGVDAKELPGGGPAYRVRFQILLVELTQSASKLDVLDLKRRIEHDFSSFSQLVTLTARMEEAMRGG